MAELTGKAISELPAAITIGDSDLLALSQNGESKKITPPVLLSVVESEISGLNSSLSTYVRPNLLDNWYFVGGGSQAGAGKFPINQRGQTSYTNAGYGIDRWKQQTFVNSTLTINGSGLTLSTTSGSAASVIYDQKFSSGEYNNLKGKTITASILVKSISGTWNLQVPNGAFTITGTGLFTHTFYVPNNYNNFEYGMRIFNTSDGTSITIEAVKLEIGSTQTLAHQEDGVWVLNEIPNLAEELAKCQRYYYKYSGYLYGAENSIFGSFINFVFPVQMASAPTITNITGITDKNWVTPDTVSDVSNASAMFRYSAGNTETRPVLLTGFSASADL